MTDSMKNKELIAVGHEFARSLSNDTPIIEIAKMLTQLAGRLDCATLALRETVTQRDALAAENAGLKSAFDKPDAWLSWHSIPPTFYEPDRGGEYLQVHEKAGEKNDDGSDSWAVYRKPEAETPVTNAILAEVRAQVWLEGNEPVEFGRYWVRYETDVGPQYCSAQWMEYNFCAGSDTNIHKIWLADHSRSINSLKGVTHYTKLPETMESAQLRQGGAV